MTFFSSLRRLVKRLGASDHPHFTDSVPPQALLEPSDPPEPSDPQLDNFRIPPRRLDEYNFFDFSDLEADTLERLFSKTARYWRMKPTDPLMLYFSVLTNYSGLTDLSHEDRKKFLDTGQKSINEIVEIFYSHWTGTRKPDVMDFGCGVGRLALHAAPHANNIVLVDFSQSQLEEAQRNMVDFGAFEADVIMIDNLGDLSTLPQSDLVYSFITLQHNTPPVMEEITRKLLNALQPGGVAVLHIPLAFSNYSFDPYYYLQDDNAGTCLEMHILPRNNLNQLAERSNCKIVASYGKGGTGDYYSEWVVFRRFDDDWRQPHDQGET